MKRALTFLSIASLLTASGCEKSAGPPAAAIAAPTAMNAADHLGAMPSAPRTLADWAHGAQLFDGLGHVHRRVTTSSPAAQQYVDQGFALMWGFNHDEATRSFAKAAELDPHCASCYWGVALTVGPNYNLPFLAKERAQIAFDALREARDQATHADAVEQALIAALAKRYPTASALDATQIAPALVTYATAMKSVAAKFPDDLDVQTLYAEALMNVNAWKLWTADGRPAAGTETLIATLEYVLARDPKHAGANHYLVHALEASPRPELALTAAERLKTLMPAAGHMVHMPAHIMQRLGRYEEAAEANRQGARADEAYVHLTRPLDYYPVMYTAHNYQFLAASAAMEGRKAEAIAATDASRRTVTDTMLLAMPGMDWYLAESYTARVRFGMWDELLKMPAPNAKLVALTGGYLYGRGVALAATGRLADARATLGQLETLAANTPANAPAGMNTLRDVLAVGIPIVQARIAAASHPDDALAALRRAVAAEDRLAYNEPQDWFFPTRHLLGALLMQLGRPVDAEIVYREDLQRNPDNGWALQGLGLALQAQGRTVAVATVARQLESAWQHSDILLTSSAF